HPERLHAQDGYVVVMMRMALQQEQVIYCGRGKTRGYLEQELANRDVEHEVEIAKLKAEIQRLSQAHPTYSAKATHTVDIGDLDEKEDVLAKKKADLKKKESALSKIEDELKEK
ncbi:hypothetical protein F442_15051, partial [Phytophthora nicotianae P10297]